MKTYGRMLVILVGAIATAMVLQGAFDASDHQKGERAVRNYRAPSGSGSHGSDGRLGGGSDGGARGVVGHVDGGAGGVVDGGVAGAASASAVSGLGPALGELVEREAPGGMWSTEITHSCRGVVRVTYSAPGGSYAFDYDVPEHAIHPGNAAAERILGSLAPAPAR